MLNYNGDEIELYTQNLYKYNNVPVTFGCGLDGDGNPWRNWKGKLTDVHVRLLK